MPLLTQKERNGLMVAVITGGRPALRDRPTSKYLDALAAAGHPVCWVMGEWDQPDYERDKHEQVVFTRDWAEAYAAEHWTMPGVPEPGQFLGAFVGREWACLEAERRGCWGVLQLDDNIVTLAVIANAAGFANEKGGLRYFADLLGAAALATNGRTVGAQLNSVPGQKRWLRPGFPYSLFVERIGPDREHWYGPFEDDIMHSLQYGSRAERGTALVFTALKYGKETKKMNGMRKNYNHQRSKGLVRVFPEVAKSTVIRGKSNGAGAPRVFHKMANNAIRTPLVVVDRERFKALQAEVVKLADEWRENTSARNRAKMERRARGEK